MVHGIDGYGEGYEDVPCNALCRDDIHVDLCYATPEQSNERYAAVWKVYHPLEILVGVEDAKEASAEPTRKHFLAVGPFVTPSDEVKRARRPVLVRWKFNHIPTHLPRSN